ncbi:hypothetical protein CDIK_3295 [Cucumispora dikerogammari]|nr:hypothetical protein CDIK_3295 [Cucumispora dikerogammari]
MHLRSIYLTANMLSNELQETEKTTVECYSLLETLKRLKKHIMDINIERKKLVEEFDIYIDRLIDEIICTKNPAHLLISGYDCFKFDSSDPEEPLSLRYLAQQKIFRKLFFVDLISYCHYFFSKINSMLTAPFRRHRKIYFDPLYKLFYDLASTQIFFSELNEFMEYINDIISSDYNFSYFIERLETRIYEKTHNPITNLRVCLYLNNDQVFDVNYNNQILVIYHTFSSILRLMFQFKFDEYKDEGFLRIKEYIWPFYLDKDTKDLLIKYYRDYIKLEIIYEHNNSKYPNRDPRFCEYIKRRHIFDSTCSEKHNIFFSICCKKHSLDIREISQGYFKHIPSNFVYGRSSFFIELYKINSLCGKAIKHVVDKIHFETKKN